MKYLTIDATLNGTGIRDQYNGGYLSPEELSLDSTLTKRLKKWLKNYENEYFSGYEDKGLIDELDKEGKAIAIEIKNSLKEVKVEYFSDAKMKKEPL